jgi:hypothetical protein
VRYDAADSSSMGEILRKEGAGRTSSPSHQTGLGSALVVPSSSPASVYYFALFLAQKGPTFLSVVVVAVCCVARGRLVLDP